MIIQTRYESRDKNNLKFRLVLNNWITMNEERIIEFNSYKHIIITEVTYV